MTVPTTAADVSATSASTVTSVDAGPAQSGRRAPIDPRLWRYSVAARGYLLWTVATSVLDVVMVVVVAIFLGRILAGVITTDQRSIGDWSVELAVLTGAIVVRVAASWLHARYSHRTASRVVAELEQEVLVAATGFSPHQLHPRRPEIVTVLTRGLDGLREYLTGYVPALLSAAVLTPVVIVVIALHDLVSAVIIVVTLPLIPLFMILIGFLTKGKAERTLAATSTLSAQMLDLVAGLPTLRALGREKGPARQIRVLGDSHRRTTMSALRVAFLSGTVLEFLATLSVALVAVSIGMRLVYGGMPLEAGVIALVLAPEAYRPLRDVGAKFHAAEDGLTAAGRAFAVLDTEPAVATTATTTATTTTTTTTTATTTTTPAAPPATSTPTATAMSTSSRGPASTPAHNRAGGREIVFSGVSVSGRDGRAPSGLDATCRPGQITVLTGHNGAGKSTALLALLGLVPLDEGAITVDGDPVSADSDWWGEVAWLPQRPALVPGTLRENLELAGVEPADVEAEHLCAATGFDEVLAECDAGWETVVGTGGTGLSLGQRQRLALTRTLASPRPVLLLDEPTAHLDEVSEARVLATLRELARLGRTVIIVAHRPTVIAVGDDVVTVRAEGTDA